MSLSFFDRLRMALDRGQRVNLPADEVHSFAPLEGLCDLILRLIGSGVKNRVLHYGGLTKVSYYQFGCEFAKRFHYDPNLIVAKNLPTREGGGSIYDYSLNSTQAVELLKIKPFLLQEGFDLIEQQLIPRT